MPEIILASMSGRRSRILRDCGIDHRVIPSGVKELNNDDKHVAEIVQINASVKAEKVASAIEDSLILSADTLVSHNDEIIGKPFNRDSALDMLKRFTGSELEVYTGLCVLDQNSGRKAVGFDKSVLFVAELKKSQIEKYFQLLAPYDKAGGFSIEGVGALVFDDIRGSYYNILGLPMIRLGELFQEIDLDILDYMSVS